LLLFAQGSLSDPIPPSLSPQTDCLSDSWASFLCLLSPKSDPNCPKCRGFFTPRLEKGVPPTLSPKKSDPPFFEPPINRQHQPRRTIPITTNPGDFLENKVHCLDKSIRYRKRPTSLVTVRSTLSIIAIHSLSSVNMELTADVYLSQTWLDRRCAFRGLPGQGTVLTLYSGQGTQMSHTGLANLWQPDTHFLNAKKSTRPEVVTRILSVGIVETRTRFAITTSCPMDLRLFPMDRQVCSLVIQSSALPNNELTYKWRGNNSSKLVFLQGLNYQDSMTTEIKLLGYKFREGVKSRPDELSGDTYDQIVLDLFLERPIGYFLWEVYMPATFIVVISFTSFWLERSATPARVSLGVTTVLTITTLLSSSNSNLPPTAYPKVRNFIKFIDRVTRKHVLWWSMEWHSETVL
jgi:gamma-aminobutyric acid receptor subunit beta